MAKAAEFEAQEFTAPDGTKMVILRREDWEAVCALARHAAANIEEGTMNIPHDVTEFINLGLNPVAAWRRHAGLTQAALAEQVGVTQGAIARIEALPVGAGRDDTLKRIAEVVGAPHAHINPPATTPLELMRKAVANSTDARTGRLVHPTPVRR